MTPNVRTLVELLELRAGDGGDRRAYTFLADGEAESASLTYAEVAMQARAIAATLAERGIAPGERALLLYPPGLEFIAAFFGCLYAGVIAVPAYPPNPAQLARTMPRLVSVATDAEVAVVFCVESLLQLAAPSAAQFQRFAALQWIATDRLVSEATTAWRSPRMTGDTLAFLQYTSGSTAAPKGVMVSHGNLLHNLGYANFVEENDAESVSVSWLPVIHDMGLIEGVLEPAYAGYPAYLMSPAAFLQRPLRWLQAITRYRATNSGGPNFAYDLCVRKILPQQRETLDLSSWRVAYNGAEPIRRSTLLAFHDDFRDVGFRWKAFFPVYGLAEATLVVSSGRREDEPVARDADTEALAEGRIVTKEPSHRSTSIVSSGFAHCGTRLHIVNPESGEPCAPHEVGEIWVSSPSVARGYWRRPEQSRLTFEARLPDGDGPFLRTGDLGALCDGQLLVTGRLKDLLIVRGLKHYPQDLELTAERQHPAVRAGCCAAFSVEGAEGQSVAIVAEVDSRRFQCLESEERHLLADVGTAIRSGIAEEHGIQLHAVWLLAPGTMPKTTSGKLQRHACRTSFLSDRLEALYRWTTAVVLSRDAILAESTYARAVLP